jgi:hypothetical protein
VAQQLVSDPAGTAQRQRRGGGIEIMAAGYPPIGEAIAGVKAEKIPAERSGWRGVTPRIRGHGEAPVTTIVASMVLST